MPHGPYVAVWDTEWVLVKPEKFARDFFRWSDLRPGDYLYASPDQIVTCDEAERL